MDIQNVPTEVKNDAWARNYRSLAGEWWSCPGCDETTLPFEDNNMCESCFYARDTRVA